MPKVFHPLLLILANASHRELTAQVLYLKVEHVILTRPTDAVGLNS